MSERLPNLSGMSVEDLTKLLAASKDNPVRTDLIYRAMSVEQLEEMYAGYGEELDRRAKAASENQQPD